MRASRTSSLDRPPFSPRTTSSRRHLRRRPRRRPRPPSSSSSSSSWTGARCCGGSSVAAASGGCACMGTFYYMNQKHVVPESAVVFVRDRKRHAIASLNTGSLCCSEWILPNRTTESCAYISRSVYSYLWCWCLRWGIWVSGRSDQSFCADTDIFFPQPFRPFSRRLRIVPLSESDLRGCHEAVM